jgi:hypothetical protein
MRFLKKFNEELSPEKYRLAAEKDIESGNELRAKKFKEWADKREVDDRSEEEEQLMGKLLHLYGSIPLPKEKASIVIKKIIDGIGKNFIFGDDLDIEKDVVKYPHDKVRFKDYFDSLINDKDSRGHNFEGTLCGLFNGKLSKRGEKWDIILNDLTWSIKFIDIPSKAPEIGSFNKALEDKNYKYQVEDVGGLTRLFRESENQELKEKVFDVISSGITGGWIISYAVGNSIIMNIVDVETMKKILIDKRMTAAPKGGLKSMYSLAISAKFKNVEGVKVSKIKFPKISLEELREIYKSDTEDKWAQEVFGNISSKIRPDVIRNIRKNSEVIGKNLLKYKDFI